ncbi:MAG: esterase-like activity of phytase family protein, partial [Hyphomicrobiaceae bacterium]
MPLAKSFKLTLLVVPLTLVGGIALAFAKPNASRLTTEALTIRAAPIRSFAKSGRGGDQVGRLRFRGGLVLRTTHTAFGGFSGLEISPDGKQLLAVSDAGAWLKAKLQYRNGRPAGLHSASLGPILALGNKRLRRGRDRDAEALRLLTGDLKSGIVLVGFEANQRIGYFKLRSGRIHSPSRYLRPPVRLGRNKGIEATGVLRAGPRKGAIVAFAERTLDRNGHHRGWIWHRGKVLPLALTNVAGFDITDIAGAMDGSLYVLERRFRWSEGVKMRIRRIAAKRLKPGAVLSGEIMMAADLGSEIDNMEGL